MRELSTGMCCTVRNSYKNFQLTNVPLLPVGARFTFAIKMSPSKEIAEKKSFIEQLDVLYEIMDKLEGDEAIELRNVIQDIYEGKVDRKMVQRIMTKYEE